MKLLKRLKKIKKGLLGAKKAAPKKALAKPARAAPKAAPKRIMKKAMVKKAKKQAPESIKKAKLPQRAHAKKTARKPQRKALSPKLKRIAKQAPKKALAKPARAAPKAAPKKIAEREARHPKRRDVSEFAQSLMAQQEEATEKKIAKQYPVLPGGQNARITMLLPLLRELVKKQVISDWLIDAQHTRNANIYVERNFTVEDELMSIREDVLVTIYQRFPDGTMGEAQIPVITVDPAAARQQIIDAKETCMYARKKAFNLPEPVDGVIFPQSYDEKMLGASFAGSGLQIPRELYQSIKAIMTPITDVKMNCFEILTSASTARVLNSNGIDVSYHKTMAYLEAVLTCKAGGEEREFVTSRIATSPEQLDVQSLLQAQAQIARDATTAQPNPGFTGDVLLAGQSVTEVFAPHHNLNPLVLHTSAKLETMGLTSFKLNQPLGHFIGEPITISLNPHLPLGLGTAPVDEEGTPLRQVELVRNGTFVNYMATTRYAQYLGVQVTGNISNVQVSPGATREQHLRGNNYFEIVSFSWFNPNPFSGDFSAEIRLGYHWVNGRRTAFRGGTFTGNMFKNILNTRFSKETTLSGSYYGPRAILFKQGQITKME